jgi:hypothetical protein
MSAQQGAPAFGRAQTGTPRPRRLTQRAMAVTGATLCAPLVAAVGLAAIGTSGGGDQAQMGTLAGAQGLRGSTVAATNPAPPAPSPPAEAVKDKGQDASKAAAVEPRRQPTQGSSPQPRSNPAPSTRVPAHKPPTQVKPKPPRSRVPVSPTTPATPIVDPDTPGAPTSGTSGGGGEGDGSGSNSGPGSSSGSGSGSSSDTAYPGGPGGQSGGD